LRIKSGEPCPTNPDTQIVSPAEISDTASDGEQTLWAAWGGIPRGVAGVDAADEADVSDGPDDLEKKDPIDDGIRFPVAVEKL